MNLLSCVIAGQKNHMLFIRCFRMASLQLVISSALSQRMVQEGGMSSCQTVVFSEAIGMPIIVGLWDVFLISMALKVK